LLFNDFLSRCSCRLFEVTGEAQERLLEQPLVLAGALRGITSTEQAAVEIDKAHYLANVVIHLGYGLAVDGFEEGFLELGWQFQVFVLHGESDRDQTIEAELLSEVFIEVSALELLEEEDEDLGQALWVVILDGKVVFALQATNEALDEEVRGEGEVWAVSVLYDMGYESNTPNLSILVGCMLVDGLEGDFDLSRWVVLVQIDHLQVSRRVLRQCQQGLVQLILEHVDGLGRSGLDTLLFALLGVLLEVLVEARLANLVILDNVQV